MNATSLHSMNKRVDEFEVASFVNCLLVVNIKILLSLKLICVTFTRCVLTSSHTTSRVTLLRGQKNSRWSQGWNGVLVRGISGMSEIWGGRLHPLTLSKQCHKTEPQLSERLCEMEDSVWIHRGNRLRDAESGNTCKRSCQAFVSLCLDSI